MNNKLIIALYNSANQGKTSTLRKLSEYLTVKYRSELQEIHIHEFENQGRDFIMTFHLYGKSFSVISEGDAGKIVKRHLENHRDSNVIICTTRTKGGTVEAVKQFAKANHAKLIWSYNYAVDLTLKQFPQCMDEANQLKAQHLWKMVEEITQIQWPDSRHCLRELSSK